MPKTYSGWLGRQVVLQVDAGESQVPLRGRVLNESPDALRFRLEGRWDVDIFKEMIVRVEADNGPAFNPGVFERRDKAVPATPRPGLLLIDHWNCALDIWWSNHFSRQLCYKMTLWTGLAGSILFLLALQIGVSHPLSFFIRVICGFLGLVLGAVSLGCGAWLLAESPKVQAQIIPYWSDSVALVVRWLRLPSKP